MIKELFLFSLFLINNIQVKVNGSTCGQPAFKPLNSRVINGVDAANNSYPWMAALFINYVFFCGGSIVSDNVILTAAHCFDKLPSGKLSVLVGTNYLASFNDSSSNSSNKYFAKKIVLHPKYKQVNQFDNDFALIQLDRKIIYSDTVMPICLPDNTDVKEVSNKTLTTAGW